MEKPPSTLRVLVGVEGPERQWPQLDAAAMLQRHLAAKVRVIHVMPPPLPEWIEALTPHTLSDAQQIALSSARAELGSRLATWADRLQAEADFIVGHPGRELLEQAALWPADLIVLGPRRERALDVGGTTRLVLAKSPCPVWVQTSPAVPLQRILVAYDGSYEAKRALDLAATLARAFSAHITVLQCLITPEAFATARGGSATYPRNISTEKVLAESEATFKHALGAYSWQGLAHDLVFADALPERKILELQSNVDLIVMGTHGRTGLSRYVLGSVAYAVTRSARVPVLAVRATSRRFELPPAE